MLAYMLATLADAEGRDWRLRSAGTHAIEDLSMSPGTLAALEGLGELGQHHYGAHRTHQLSAHDLDWADVVLAMESAQVRHLASVNERLVSHAVAFSQFVRHAPIDEPLSAQIAAVRTLGLDDAFDVADPAIGDRASYEGCANELWELAQAFAVVVL